MENSLPLTRKHLLMNKVVIISNIPAPYRVKLYKYMHDQYSNYDFHILYSGDAKSQGREWTIDENELVNTSFYKVKQITYNGKLYTRYIPFYSNISDILNRLNPDVIISFEYGLTAIQSLLWCKFKRRKYIHLTDGTIFSERNISLLQTWSRRFIIKNSDAFIASSSKSKEKLLHYGADIKKIFVALLTTNIDDYKYHISEKTSKNNILYVGKCENRKGLDLLFCALTNVKVDFKLKIIGDGESEYIEYLKQQLLKLNLHDKVSFTPFLEGNELIHEYHNADVFVLPSREDCFGLVLVEALASGLPIIASKYADGAYDVIENGVNGIITDPYDPIKMAKDIEEVLIHNRYRKNAINMSTDKFNFSHIASIYINAIDYVLSE